jgi:RNA polymerase sigma-B factor
MATVRWDEEQTTRWVLEYARRRDGHDGQQRRDDPPLAQLRERIVAGYFPLVDSIARRFASADAHDDLVQEGLLGLLSALETFDPAKGVKFSTYATHFVAGAIRHFLRDRSKIIKEPAWLQETAFKVERAVETLSGHLGRSPRPDELARAVGLPLRTVEEVLATRPIFQVMALGEGGAPASPGMIDPERVVGAGGTPLILQVDDQVVLAQAISRLKPLEEQVVRAFYFEERSQTEIAGRLGISCNYVSFLLKNAVRKLGKVISEADVHERRRRREVSVIDAGTGLPTAAAMHARLREEVSRAVRAGRPLAALALTLCPLPERARERDALLATCAELVRPCIRRYDLLGRWDTGRLLVILPDTGKHAQTVESRLYDALRPRVTLQLHTVWIPEHGATAQELLAALTQDPASEDDDTLPAAA